MIPWALDPSSIGSVMIKSQWSKAYLRVKTLRTQKFQEITRTFDFLIEYSTNFSKKILLKFLEISVSIEFSPQLVRGEGLTRRLSLQDLRERIVTDGFGNWQKGSDDGLTFDLFFTLDLTSLSVDSLTNTLNNITWALDDSLVNRFSKSLSSAKNCSHQDTTAGRSNLSCEVRNERERKIHKMVWKFQETHFFPHF